MSEDTTLLRSVVDRWDGRWCHPDLAVAIERGEQGVETLAAALLKGLVDDGTLVDGARGLIDREEFEAIDAMLAVSVLSADEASEIGRLRDRARAEVESRLRRTWTRLTDQALRVGVEPRPEPWHRWTEEDASGWQARDELFQEELAQYQLLVEQRQSEHRGTLRRRLEERRAEGASEGWSAAVEGCLASGRFDVAERLLEMGPGEGEAPQPLGVPRTREYRFLLDEGHDLDRLLSYCLGEDTPPSADHARLAPAPGDSDARTLIRAMRRLGQGVDQESVFSFVTALHQLTGSGTARYIGERHEKGVLTRLWIDRDIPAPVRACTSDGLSVWIAPADQPPPAVPVDLWIMIGPGTPARAADGEPLAEYARLDAFTLLRLTARGLQDGLAKREYRAVNLLRLICARSPLHRAVTEPVPGRGRLLSSHELAWLLDLLGLSADAVCQDLLRYETGGHLGLLVDLLAGAVQETGQARSHPLSVVDINMARRDMKLQEKMRLRLESVLADPAVGAILLTSALYYWENPGEEFSFEQVMADMAVLLSTDRSSRETVEQRLAGREEELRSATRRLICEGLLLETESGRYALPFNGLRDLLWEPTERRRELAISEVHRMNDQVPRSRRTTADGLSDQVVAMISHDVQGELNRIIGSLTEAEGLLEQHPAGRPLQEARRWVNDFESIRERYQRCLTESEVFDVKELLRGARNRFNALSELLEIDPIVEIGGPAMVRVNQQLFIMIIMSFLRNSSSAIAEALSRHPPRGDKVFIPTVKITLQTEGEWCTVSVEDNGPGRGAGISTGTEGRGNILARQVIEGRYGGRLEEKPDGSGPVGLPGAHTKVTLPLAE